MGACLTRSHATRLLRSILFHPAISSLMLTHCVTGVSLALVIGLSDIDAWSTFASGESSPWLTKLQTASFILSFCTNLIATILIGYKLWYFSDSLEVPRTMTVCQASQAVHTRIRRQGQKLSWSRSCPCRHSGVWRTLLHFSSGTSLCLWKSSLHSIDIASACASRSGSCAKPNA